MGVSDPRPLFRAHVDQVSALAAGALERAARSGEPAGGLVLHSGTAGHYHAQDRGIPFQPVPHFARFAPLALPDQVLLMRAGSRPKLIEVRPSDFWYETAPAPDHPYRDCYDVSVVGSREDAVRELGDVSDCAYVGDDPTLAGALGIRRDGIEPPALLASMDWDRACKTAYEVECIREAARIAGLGHAAARERADDHASERQIHLAYLAESGMLENETPYGNIVAWDEASATLHYSSRRATTPERGATFLIDAGGAHLGYASDVTRTYAYANAHPVFRQALVGMERLQRSLVESVGPGVEFVDLHARAMRGVCELLRTLGVLLVDSDQAIDLGIAYAFLPHGLGHHLGLQVHDVGGHQLDPSGKIRPPPERFPNLRTTRRLEAGHVITIEPGLYFIPLLLNPLRSSTSRSALDWDLLDALVPCGGIRIEDDVLVTPDGFEDLSRPFTPPAPSVREVS